MLYLGRGTSYPIALEGALKLKEISYIHAEGYAAGELKHGPIALIDETMPVIVIAPYDRVFEKTVSNMQEVAARGGKIILVTDPKGAAEATVESLVTLTLPEMPATVTPLVYAIPVQLIAYHTAVHDGHGRGPAAQSGEIRHRRVGTGAVTHLAATFRRSPHKGNGGPAACFPYSGREPGWMGSRAEGRRLQ